MERMHAVQQVTCPKCGLKMEVHLKESGFENLLNETTRKCRHEKGSAVLRCPMLRLAILAAQRSLQKL
jgi:ssDNA-binding Zn-finger/Zn-ribbon topoisomerase 1